MTKILNNRLILFLFLFLVVDSCHVELKDRTLSFDLAKKEIEETAEKIQNLFSCKLKVEYSNRKMTKGRLGFYTKGICTKDGGEGIITVSVPTLADNLITMKEVLDRDTLSFVMAHEASHVLLGHTAKEFGQYYRKKKNQNPRLSLQLSFWREEDCNTLGAKIHKELGKPLTKNILTWSDHMDVPHYIKNPPQYSSAIQLSYKESWSDWSNWRQMGPICQNNLAPFFEKKGANKELTQKLKTLLCDLK